MSIVLEAIDQELFCDTHLQLINSFVDGGLLPVVRSRCVFSPGHSVARNQPLLPECYSPINTTSGRGNQGVYLAGLDDALGHLLIKLIEQNADAAIKVHLLVLAEERDSSHALFDDVQALQEVVSTTEREALTKARLGQGLFRHRVAEQEPICRVTGLARQVFLIASHIKPWRDSTHAERLDGANGLLLSPHVDKLFDRHYWISFDTDGQLIWQHEAAGDALRCWGLRVQM